MALRTCSKRSFEDQLSQSSCSTSTTGAFARADQRSAEALMHTFNKGLILLFLLCFSSGAFGQATGLITGTVHDSTGAVIQGAEVVVTDTATRTQFTTITNGEGNYLVASLGSGTYDLMVSAPGFKKFQA